MNRLRLDLVGAGGELDLGFLDLDDDLSEDVKGDFRYEADFILKDEGVNVNDFFRATHDTTGQKYDLAARFTREFLATADAHAINVVCEATIEAFFRLAEKLKEEA
ncbi:hypothetical protein SEA_HUWBERT_61 [Microbacterium phage Huwbert]|nr:hypothetical protein SEA_HUWBERT_61 [Microbacterium phage Huwbert]